jgi:sugar phosphate permease
MGSARPTHVRYVVVLLATLVAVMLYLDRVCLSMAGPYVQEEMGLSKTQMGWLLGVFFLTYAIGQVPAGWLSDRYGARLTLALYLALWSSFTGWMGLATGFLLLLVLRLACGLTEAGAYPACASLLSVWVPTRSRALASGIVSLGGRAGGAVAQVLTGYLIVLFSASAPSTLGDNDLLDVSSFGRTPTRASEMRSEPARRTLLARLPTDAQAVVRAAAETKDFRPTPEQSRVLAQGLNELLKQRDLYRGIDLGTLDLPKEAMRLAAVPESDLSEGQVERRNRLLLEAAFPQAVRKVYGPGWRPTMLWYGAAGLAIAVIFWWFFRDRPRLHPACNAAEVSLIEGDATPAVTLPPRRPLPWRGILTSPSLWLVSWVQFCTNLGWAFLLTWLPDYLKEEHNVPIETRGWMAGLTLVVGIPGMFLGGWLSDRLTARLGPWWGRSGLLALTRFLVLGAFLACVWLRSPWEVTLALAVVSFGTDLGTPAVWAYCQDVGGRHVGSVLGWGNMWGNFGAWLSPVLLAVVVQEIGWDAMFLTCAGAFLVAGISSLGINASRPVVPDEA